MSQANSDKGQTGTPPKKRQHPTKPPKQYLELACEATTNNNSCSNLHVIAAKKCVDTLYKVLLFAADPSQFHRRKLTLESVTGQSRQKTRTFRTKHIYEKHRAQIPTLHSHERPVQRTRFQFYAFVHRASRSNCLENPGNCVAECFIFPDFVWRSATRNQDVRPALDLT